MPSPTASSVARRGLNGLLSLNGCRACGACVASVGSNGTGTPRRPLSTTRLNRAAANEGGTNTNTPHPVSNIPPDDPAHPFLTMSRQARFHPADGSATHAEHQQHGQPMPRTSHPYFSTQLDEYAKKEISPITLKDLLRLGKGQEGLVESGRWLREELPKRLARRVRAIETLPFIVGLNPYIRHVYNLYRDSFDQILSFPPIETPADEVAFTDMLTDLVGAHADVIPRLAKGFLECDRYMTRPAIAAWLDRMIHSRIGIRVIAEHHLALHHPMDNWIGIVNTKLNPISLVRDVAHVVAELAEANYGSAPDVIVQGPSDTRFAYIPVHLEYMLTELIKNSVRATIEHKRAQRKKRGEQIGVGASEEYEPVVVTVAPGPGVVTFRISDQGGGIPYDDVTKAFEYSYTTVTSEEAKEADGYDDGGRVLADVLKADMERQTGGPMAGLGFGLPMSNIYAKYFGGSLGIESMYGYGCDTYLTLRDIGDVSNLKIKD